MVLNTVFRSTSVTVILASAILAPDLSVTRPEMEPLIAWPYTSTAPATTITRDRQKAVIEFPQSCALHVSVEPDYNRSFSGARNLSGPKFDSAVRNAVQ